MNNHEELDAFLNLFLLRKSWLNDVNFPIPVALPPTASNLMFLSVGRNFILILRNKPNYSKPYDICIPKVIQLHLNFCMLASCVISTCQLISI